MTDATPARYDPSTDLDSYDLSNIDLTEDEAEQFLEILSVIMLSIVRVGLGLDPVSQILDERVLDKLQEIDEPNPSAMVEYAHAE
ncbi:hypothetical protein [Ponticaulis sp.]|uniref:hypothetical protein n=1 Tax=Ponticaulis sp. TaxID=2020902 RepID=UPI000C5DF8AD|nr:hypothetical protein [Ponticaulis sp.]MAJ10324.1 hypothetical protein [Ponticaulis sp.]HBH91465.1 hypothetical protein [Hyphomonadaceae bacterium]HBJ94300.1 hypothetical protein [Hyphomonadaceae bacterium]|tara:strand:- start:1140 stop:1394 length:255 start_codon:yes stop_codon:yes gene_type:complete